MFYFCYDRQKERNILVRYWLRIVFVLFRIIPKNCCQSNVFSMQGKQRPCRNLVLNPNVLFYKYILKGKRVEEYIAGLDLNQNWIRIAIDLGCYWIRKFLII